MKILRVVFLLLIVISCTKTSNVTTSVGTITSNDPLMCGCCGGWFVEIDGEEYRIVSAPVVSGIDLSSEKLPVTVKLDWMRTSSGCPDDWNRITVLWMVKL
jgi:hypothetical protein